VEEIRESHDLTRRLPPESKWFEEIRQLSENFNDMISRLEIANQQLVQDSEEDPLTGVFNRRKFDNVAEFELEVARRNSLDVSFLMFDLNKFKPINDELGHAAGDMVLVEVARLLRESVRDSDVCGRFGGDEFMIMAPETDGAQALHLGSVLKSAIQGLKIEFDSRQLNIGVSVGVSTFPYDADRYDDLINIADNRMYKDKHTREQGELIK
jgi:diguanylate cyclase (GGDEF)-like protein